MKRVAISLIAFLLLGLFGCVATAQEPQAQEPPAISVLVADSAFHHFVANVRLRQVDHKRLPDEETVLCLYGLVRNDTAYIAFNQPTAIQPMGSWQVAFLPCRTPNPEHFGSLRLLGMWHPHTGGADCDFSTPDKISFNADRRMLIDVVSCSRGLIWRGRK